jgi:arylsulfatase A-like enzyme
LIIADDLGYGEVECYPNVEDDRLPTPHIDALAQDGVRCSQGYAADSMCWPSRASILTGRYHQRFARTNPLPEEERAIAQYLKRLGYATGCIGKWHNTGSIGAWDLRPINHPSGWGFDDFAGFLGGMHDYFDPQAGTHFLRGRNRDYYMPVYEGTRPVAEIGYMTDWITNQAVRFLQRHGQPSWPYFLYVSYTAIHSPNQAPPHYLDRNQGDVRRAMLDAMDCGVGKIVETIDQLDQRDNTLVLFVGDNGGYRDTSNWVLRGRKGGCFEGGIRGPFILSWPGELPARRVYDHPVMHIDILPTVLAAAGGKLPNNLDGKNLLPHLRGELSEPPHDVLFWGRENRFAVRKGPWKLVNERDERDGPTAQYLFNLEEDISEQHNLADQHPAILQQLIDTRQAWQATLR